MSSLIKIGLPNKFHMIFRISKQQLNTSYKQFATHGNLVGNSVFFYQGRNFMLSIFLCLAALWNWALVVCQIFVDLECAFLYSNVQTPSVWERFLSWKGTISWLYLPYHFALAVRHHSLLTIYLHKAPYFCDSLRVALVV